MIAIVRVNVRRAVGDRRLLFVATAFPVLFILVTGLFANTPSEPVGLVHPPARLLAADSTDERAEGAGGGEPGHHGGRHPARPGGGGTGHAARARTGPSASSS